VILWRRIGLAKGIVFSLGSGGWTEEKEYHGDYEKECKCINI
jgi:hypothetical protein